MLHSSAVIGALLVIHKGVIRTIIQSLTGALPDRDHPAFGEAVILTRSDAGAWKRGAHSSNPPNIDLAAPVTVAR